MSDKNFWDFMIAAAQNWRWTHTVSLAAVVLIPTGVYVGFLTKSDLFNLISAFKGWFN